MGPEITIAMLIAAWLAVAAAMLWGVMRISRRHHHREIEHENPANIETRHDHSTSNSFRLR
ncbi:hypothetical protein QN375_10815 [Pseudomonas sp. MH9.2]|uniref:hypothetical protein n=1 Tax=unclassified Pseudomonas TaxID=196821 RepID=UPI002AC8F34D|nr:MULTISPECIES: hypothetical protein [unclassified Pseudomonas]MEB0008170.1 hypothetical protein [Pseudomonas sp. RTB2]MEB0015892.1 hypothetical protein [Pseudomonas sp. RTB3]MEB0026261.1 hypothetical protein [Pseudomonas sp. MH9.2]MEB0146879.1 hypothetical protein [Pseudomonas sp. CCC2.2]MEB0270894.1 hypothetical protein [Pseudomonas sp. 5B4]